MNNILNLAAYLYTEQESLLPFLKNSEARSLLRQYDQSRLLRKVNRAKTNNNESPEVIISGNKLMLEGEVIGVISNFYKKQSPSEKQAKLAYEFFYSKLIEFLQKRQIFTLQNSDFHIQLLSSQVIDLEAIVTEFLEDCFSIEGLKESFILYINNFRISNRGTGLLKSPIYNDRHALVMATFYLKTIFNVQGRNYDTFSESFSNFLNKGLEQIELVEQLQQEFNATSGKKERTRLSKKIERAQDKVNFDRLWLQQKLSLLQKYPDPFEFLSNDPQLDPLRSLLPLYDFNINFINISRNDIFLACVKEIYLLLKAHQRKTPNFLSDSLTHRARMPGDNNKKVCSCCGNLLDSKDKYDANRYVVESPVQRPQSSSTSAPLPVCYECALVASISPLKPSDYNVLIHFEDPLIPLSLASKSKKCLNFGNNLIYYSPWETETFKSWSQIASEDFVVAFLLAQSLPLDILVDLKCEVDGEVLLPRHLVFFHGLLNCYAISQINHQLVDIWRYVQNDNWIVAQYNCISLANNISLEDLTFLDKCTGIAHQLWEQSLQEVG